MIPFLYLGQYNDKILLITIMSSFNSDLIRNDTNLDVINAYDVPLNTPPPNIIVSSPCGRVLAIATPIGITFYWTDTMNDNNNNRDKNNNNNNNIHSVRLPERISSMKFFPVINNKFLETNIMFLGYWLIKRKIFPEFFFSFL